MNSSSNQHLLTILTRLNQIGAAINHCESGNLSNLGDTLRLIVSSAKEVVPGSSAVIYTYDTHMGSFDITSRVASEQHDDSQLDDAPRLDGMGARAIKLKQRILSYDLPDYEIN
ncbi:MAG: hypothetical protein ACK2U1_03015, partial [Anaerolineales bacterium]